MNLTNEFGGAWTGGWFNVTSLEALLCHYCVWITVSAYALLLLLLLMLYSSFFFVFLCPFSRLSLASVSSPWKQLTSAWSTWNFDITSRMVSVLIATFFWKSDPRWQIRPLWNENGTRHPYLSEKMAPSHCSYSDGMPTATHRGGGGATNNSSSSSNITVSRRHSTQRRHHHHLRLGKTTESDRHPNPNPSSFCIE